MSNERIEQEYTDDELAKIIFDNELDRELAAELGVFDHNNVNLNQEQEMALEMSARYLKSLAEETNSTISDLLNYAGINVENPT